MKIARKARAGRFLGAVNDLTRLVSVYGDTDKLQHGYLPLYERHLGRYRFRKLVVLEIGVGGYESELASGSLPVWRDYFARSTIVGFDIHEKHIGFGSRVHFQQGDQSNPQDLEQCVTQFGPPSIVIDDGSHIGTHIRTSFDFLWPLMPANGVYVIEDLSTSYYPQYGGGNPPPADSAMSLLEQLADSVQARDPTFKLNPDLGQRSDPTYADVAALHVYPGIAFIEKGP